jgi:hypothetical protein
MLKADGFRFVRNQIGGDKTAVPADVKTLLTG